MAVSLLYSVGVVGLIMYLISVRHRKVYKFRYELYHKVYQIVYDEFQRANNLGDLYERFKTAELRKSYLDSIGTDKMVLFFWKPVDSFYTNKSLLFSSTEDLRETIPIRSPLETLH